MRLVRFTIFISLLAGAEWAIAACTSGPHSTSLATFAVNSNATKIAAAAADGTVILWDAKSGSKTDLLECYPAPITTIAFSPDSSMVAFGDAQGVVTLWDLPSSRVVHKLAKNMGQVEQISISEDGERLAASGLQGAKVWQLRGEKEINAITNEGIGGAISLNRDGTVIAVGGYGRMALWDVLPGQLIRSMSVPEGDWVDKLVFARNDRWIISAEGRKGIVVWDAQTGSVVKILSGQTDNAFFSIVSPDTSIVLSVADDGTLRSWDLETGHLKSTWKTSPGFISADGRFLLRSSSQPGRLELWRIGDPIKNAQPFTYRSPLCAENVSAEGTDAGGKQVEGLQSVGMGESRASDGTHLSFTTYVTPDCKTVTIMHGTFASASSAEKELDFQAGKAARVIEKGRNKDFLGNNLGRRALLVFAETDGAPTVSAAIWTDGNRYAGILSSSLPLVQSLEKQYRH